MLIARAPLRISFLGGGTDFPEYFEEHGGEVLSTAIDKFSYVSLSRLLGFFDHNIRVSYSKTELVDRAEDVQHKAVKAALQYCGLESHIEINCISDLPARTGLGSSGSFIVALLNALHAYKGEYVSPERLGIEAIEVERDILRDNVGCQDQFAAAVGGFNLIRFYSQRDIRHSPIVMHQNRKTLFNDSLMMFYTGIQRSASEISEEQVKNTSINYPYLCQMKALVRDGQRILESSQDLRDFGLLLDEGWKLKQTLSTKISNGIIDEMYAAGKKAGAIGGKLLGAGGGGFLLLHVEPEKQNSVRKALFPFKEVPFRFEETGCQIVYHRSPADTHVMKELI